MSNQPLATRWQTLLTQWTVPQPVAAGAWSQLQAAYQQPGRHYHNLNHIEACLNTLATLPPLPSLPLIELALWFHDIIYDTQADDNERRSAAAAQTQLTAWGLPAEEVAFVSDLIVATDHRGEPTTPAAAQIVDCDLAILGAAPAAYDAYAAAIRREYGWVPAELYHVGRGQVLDHFLARPHIYHTPTGRSRWEAAGRANLAREKANLARLTDQDAG